VEECEQEQQQDQEHEHESVGWVEERVENSRTRDEEEGVFSHPPFGSFPAFAGPVLATVCLSTSGQKQVVVNVNHARDRTGDLSSAISGLLRINPAAELNNSPHGADFDFRSFNQRIFVESGLDFGGELGVSTIFASGFLVTRHGASGGECRRKHA
jgi:hypothetical protein